MQNNRQDVFSSSNPKKYFIVGIISGVLLVCTIGFVILLITILSGSDSIAKNDSSQKRVEPTVEKTAGGNVVKFTLSGNEHIRGNKDASVKIIEFSDYQCPYCQKHHGTMQQVMDEYDGQVAWIYKHFPLDSIHPNARPAAEASECVWEQKGDEGFWEFTDAVFTNQSQIDPSFYEEWAQEQGLDMEQFDDCVSSRKYRDKVEADYQEGLKAGVKGTPANFINGISVSGAVPYSSMQQIINQELNQE